MRTKLLVRRAGVVFWGPISVGPDEIGRDHTYAFYVFLY